MESEDSDHLHFDEPQSLYLLIKRQEYARECDRGYKGSWDDFIAGLTFDDEPDSRNKPESTGLAGIPGEKPPHDNQGTGAFAYASETIEVAPKPGLSPSLPTHEPLGDGRPSPSVHEAAAPSVPVTAGGAAEARGSQRPSAAVQVADRAHRRWRGTWAIGTVGMLLLALLSWMAYKRLVLPPPASTARTPVSPATAVDSAIIAPTSGYLPTVLPSHPAPTPSLPMPSASPLPTPGSPGADRVLAFNPGPGANKEYGDPSALLGDSDGIEKPRYQGILQLGRGGSVLVAFADNSVIDGPGPDLEIHGESTKDDFLLVEVSADGQVWRAYPKLPESTGPLDLADVGLSQIFYVRLTDLQPGTATGAEVDAVVALNSGMPPSGDIQSLPDGVARTDVPLRQGPSATSGQIGRLAQGDTVSLTGRNREGTWLLVSAPTFPTAWCTAASLGLNINTSSLEVVSPAPSPTSAHTATPKPAATPAPSRTPRPTPTSTPAPPSWILVADSITDYPGVSGNRKWWYVWSHGTNNFRWEDMTWDGGAWYYRDPNQWGLRIGQDYITADPRGDVAVLWKNPEGGTYRFEWDSDSLAFYEHLTFVGSEGPGSRLAHSATVHDIIQWNLFFWVAKGSSQYHILVFRLQ